MLPVWASHPMPSWPAGSTAVNPSSTTTVPGPGRKFPTVSFLPATTCIWAPVSDEPPESEMTSLGSRARASSRTAGVRGAPPFPTAKKDDRS